MARITAAAKITCATAPAWSAVLSLRSFLSSSSFSASWLSGASSGMSCSGPGGITRFDAICLVRCRNSYNRRVGATGRILAIDYGSRRMGLAVTDPLGITAQGIETLQRKNNRADFGRLERTIRQYEIKEIVLGNPLRMSGQEGTQSQKVAEFAEELRQRFELPVHLWDERLTSAEANRLLRENEVSTQKRAQAVDRMAAVLILQSFMQSRSVT